MVTRADIIAQARGWIGTPYRHQGHLRGQGCDCLGLLRGLYQSLYGSPPLPVPAYPPDWPLRAAGERLAEGLRPFFCARPLAHAAPGDILLLRWRAHLPASHAAILSAPQRMIHVHHGLHVCEVALAPAWRRRVAFCFSFPNLAD